MAVLDSACSRTVAGKLWFDIFFDTLNHWAKCLVKNAKLNKTFCLGDGVKVKPIYSVKFLVTIGCVKGVRAYIEVDIVRNDLPLLLSHKSMKTAEMLLDFKNDSCWILGRYIKLQSTTSGHYNLSLTNMFCGVESSMNVVLHCEALKKCSRVEKRKAEKLHWQFAHASKEKLIFLVKGIKIFNEKKFLDLIQDVCESFPFAWSLENLLFDL